MEVSAELEHVRGFINAISGLLLRGDGAAGGRGVEAAKCVLMFSEDGLQVHTEEDSKAVQAAATFEAACFKEYIFVGEGNAKIGTERRWRRIGRASEKAPLQIHWPGKDGELELSLSESSPAMRVYASLTTTDIEGSGWSEFIGEPISEFSLQGSVLKEAIEDLQWPNAPVWVSLRGGPPPTLALKASGSTGGELKVEFVFDRNDYASSCTVNEGDGGGKQEINFRYKHKHLRAAFCNLQAHTSGGPLRTKVAMDGEGIMKVIHLVNMTERLDDPLNRQVADDQDAVQRMAIVHLCILAEEAEDEEEALEKEG